VGPGFTLLESDLQQRLQNLLSFTALPIAEASPPAQPTFADQKVPDWLGEPYGVEESRLAAPRNSLRARAMPQPERPGLRARFGAWLLGRFEALLGKFGR
jgi:hypothetical protein